MIHGTEDGRQAIEHVERRYGGSASAAAEDALVTPQNGFLPSTKAIYLPPPGSAASRVSRSQLMTSTWKRHC